MKLAIFLFLLMLLLPYGAQLRTRYQPLPVVVRRWQTALIWPRLAVRVEIVRMG
jgi:hypothetical protein